MRNRLNLLKFNLDLEKNAREFYEKLLNKIVNSNTGIFPFQSIILNSGGSINTRSYKFVKSQKVNIGDNYFIEDNSFNIGNSYNDRKKIIEKLSDLIERMVNDKESIEEYKKKSIINFEKVKSELEEEENPDKGKIKSWLENAKNYLSIAKFCEDVFKYAKTVYDLLGIGFGFYF